MLTISIQDYATPRLQRLIAGLDNSQPLFQMAGARAQECIRDHLIALAGSRHNTAERLGAQPSGHLGKAAEKVALPSALTPIPDGVSISLNHPGMRRAFEDVDITPSPAKKYLTIPAAAEAYNRRAYRFNNLDVLYGRDGPYALAERQSPFPRRRAAPRSSGAETSMSHSAPRIFYWLVKFVHQPRDSTLLPDDNTIANAALTGAADYINLLISASA